MPKTIFEVMQEAAATRKSSDDKSESSAPKSESHEPFDQAWFSRELGDQHLGVCLALCKIWLKYVVTCPTKIVLKTYVTDYVKKVRKKQKKSMDAIAAVKRRRLEREQRGEAEPVEGEVTENRIVHKDAATAVEYGKNFWDAAAEIICDGDFWPIMRILTLHLPTGAHAVAFYRNERGTIFFFDPNGGIVQFKNQKGFKDWFATEFKKADGDKYDMITGIIVARA